MRQVAIIGAGLSGICAAVALKRRGVDDFVILEGAAEIGGTWRDNDYPGCACDIPSLLYSFSFAPNPSWSRFVARQDEIRRYVRDVFEREELGVHLRLNAQVRRAVWDRSRAGWSLETDTGPVSARAVIAGTGPWHEPVIPDLPGLADFPGPVFHSSRWDHGLDLTGRRVAVIGSGASAVQFVPRIARQVEHLTLFQRTPHWILPKPDRRLTRAERLVMSRVPFASSIARRAVFESLELFNSAMHHPPLMRQLARLGELNIRRGIRDPALRAAVTPDYPLGCKRVLISNDFYPALARRNVALVPSEVRSVDGDGVTDAAGVHHRVDTIILGTGFRILDTEISHLIEGADGRTLQAAWEGSPRGYLGTTVSGFPNAFVMLGPNAAINTAATVLMELQAGYIADAVATIARDGIASVDVRAEVQAAYNAEVDRRLAPTVWNAGTCHSYFLDANGRNGFNFPGSTRQFARVLRRFEAADYTVAYPADAQPASTGSSAWSLTSVSASSDAGSESATMPPPA